MVVLILVLSLAGIVADSFKTQNSKEKSNPIQKLLIPKKDEPFTTYTQPTIPKKDVYRVVMVGDSMTEILGPHGGKLSEQINTLYESTPGHQRILIDNYAQGSTNLLGLLESMNKKITNGDVTFDPLLSRDFDLILIESFGYNPLSQFGIKDGLKKQTETLDELMKTLITEHPNAVIVFVATIAPNKETYAQVAAPGKTVAEREAQAQERVDYIKNHMNYATQHNIPLIDIYDKSLTPKGDGDLSYIDPHDFIHPSVIGRDFISQEISNFIYESQILPR